MRLWKEATQCRASSWHRFNVISINLLNGRCLSSSRKRHLNTRKGSNEEQLCRFLRLGNAQLFGKSQQKLNVWRCRGLTSLLMKNSRDGLSKMTNLFKITASGQKAYIEYITEWAHQYDSSSYLGALGGICMESLENRDVWRNTSRHVGALSEDTHKICKIPSQHCQLSLHPLIRPLWWPYWEENYSEDSGLPSSRSSFMDQYYFIWLNKDVSVVFTILKRVK